MLEHKVLDFSILGSIRIIEEPRSKSLRIKFLNLI